MSFKGSFLRRLRLLPVLVLIGCMLVMHAQAKDGAWKGQGTESDPYLIEDLKDFLALQTCVNGGDSCSQKYFLLTTNLDLSEICGENIGSWEPIGNESCHFEGYFSGGLKEISGLYINGGETIGLFGVSDGKIERLTVSGSVSGQNLVGGIVGKNEGIIYGCSSKVTVSGNDNVGGIAGYSDGQISNCFNGGSVTGKDHVGGIAGTALRFVSFCTNAGNISGDESVGGIVGDSKASIQECLNDSGCIVEATGSYAGGIAGSASASIEKCTNKSNISTVANGAGGIAGLFNEAEISSCVNEGDISGGKDKTGGIVGEFKGTADGDERNFFNCVNNGKVSGVNNYVGGIVGDAVYCTLTECINRGAVAGSGYVGGIAGQFKNFVSLTHASNHGAVTGTMVTGGIVGFTDNSGDIKTCFNDGVISGETMNGGIVGVVILSVKNQDSSYKINNIADCTNEGKITGINQIGGISGSCSANVLGCVNKGIISGQEDVGGMVGVMRDEKNCVENCVNMGDVEGDQNVGGIVGSGGAVYIRKCRNEGCVEGTSKNVGGIIGLNTVPGDINQGEIKQCRNEGEVSNSGSNTGGIIGRAAYIGILECENTQTISAGDDKSGGIMGFGLKVTIKKCGNTGRVISEDKGVGGIAGYAMETEISDSYNRGTIYGEDRVGGLVGIFVEDNYLTRCYVKAPKDGITCERENGNVGGFYGTLLVASYVEFEDCYWWSHCANRALGSNRTDAVDSSGEGYGDLRIEAMFDEESNFRNWDFHEVWVIYGNVPVLRNTYDISPAGGRGANEENSEIGGTGYQATYLDRIYSLEDFKAFRDAVNSGYNYPNENVYLCVDLDLSADSNLYWEPIGTEGNSFDGNFYGGNHIIKGLLVSTSEYGGLFGRCRGGSIRDLAVYGTVSSSNRYVGGIVGSCAGIIDNCFFFGNVFCTHGYDGYVGGVAGLLSGHGMITDSGHVGYVSALKGCAGGILGTLNDRYSEIYHCFHYSPADYIECPSGYTGTIAGESRNSRGITECYTSLGSAERFVGRNWDSSQSGTDSCGMLDAESFRSPESFSGWDVSYDADHHWVMGADYPLPRSMSDYITFSYNDETGSSKTVWMMRGDMVLGDIELTKEGHLFNGWNDKPDGSGVSYAFGDEVPAQTTLYAQWRDGYEYHGYVPLEPDNEADEGTPGQTYDMLLDGDVDTKWCVDVHNRTSWTIQFATKDYIRVSGYCMVTADDTEDYSGRNPKSWKLEGKSPDGVWEVLDEVTDDDTLPDKNQARGYQELNNTYMYCEFRLTFTGVKEGNTFQLSEFFLLYKDPDKDVRKPRIRLHPNTILPGIDQAVVTGDNRSTVTLGGDPYNQEAYTLLSWNTDPRGIGSTYKADDPYFITNDAVVYAMWEAKQFELTINLDTFAGSPLYRRIGYKTTAQFRLTPPEREGYIFKYWIVTSGGGTWKLNEKYDANTNIYGTYGNATLAGVWEKRKEIEVSWYSDDNLIGTDTYYEGDIPEYKGEKPEKESIPEYDFTFIGWDKELKELTEDTTFNAVFEGTRRSYEITWLDEDGSQFDVTSVEYGTVPSHEPPEKQPTKESCYVFEGWEETPVAVTGNATYKAVFREIPRPYEITWQYDDGSLIDVTEVGYGTIPTHADPNKKATEEYSYTFIGWDRALSLVDGPAVYTARFSMTRNSYAVHFETNGGDAIKDVMVEYGASAKKPEEPKREGFIFEGWFADAGCRKPYTFEEKIAGETTIYAGWTEIQRSLLNSDGKPAARTGLVENGTALELITAPKTIPEGYTIEYSIDGGKTFRSGIPVGTKSGTYTVEVLYRADRYHTDFYGEKLSVTIRGVYNSDVSTVSWIKGSGKTVEFRIKKAYNDEECFAKFIGITVGGKTAEPGKDYTAVKGSTVITLSAEYLETLALGEQSVKVLFEDGEVTVGINIAEEEKKQSPGTDDSNHLWLLAVLSVVFVGAIGVTSVRKRRLA